MTMGDAITQSLPTVFVATWYSDADIREFHLWAMMRGTHVHCFPRLGGPIMEFGRGFCRLANIQLYEEKNEP